MTNRAPLILAIVLLLLPVVYVGSFYVVLEYVSPIGYAYRPAWDAKSNERISSFYRPLEQLDQKLRPKAWIRYPEDWND